MKKDFTNKTVRNVSIANDRVGGMTYHKLSKKYGVTKTQIGRILKNDEIKEIVEYATSEIIALLPKAWEVHEKSMKAVDKSGDPTALAVKASENVLKTSSVMPSNAVNQRVTNVFNQQNNIITPETMEIVKKILPGFREESDL
jgi:phosphoribosyl-dephospho-CoA transferase